ncbi:MAG: stage II sporulation protein M [Treponema sp.]|nr:stage II sporulation protein M [Treponema sp.]
MKEQNFVQRREAFWNEFEALVNGGKKEISKKAGWFPSAYREITQDLNTARAHAFDPSIIDRLNRLVLEGNQLIYGQHTWSIRYLFSFVLRDFPRAIRFHALGIALTALLFYGVAFFFGILTINNPDVVYEFIGGDQAAVLEEMYDPDSYHYLTPREVDSDADMFGYYIYNNISIAFGTFAGGIFAGIGSLFILCSNALFLGICAGHIINRQFSSTFFPFIIAHSAFELNAIVFSAYAGFVMGWRFFVRRGLSLSAAIKAAGKTSLPIIAGSALLLVLAAILEAFWSSRFTLPLELRLGAGAACWVLFLVYVFFCGRGKRQ